MKSDEITHTRSLSQVRTLTRSRCTLPFSCVTLLHAPDVAADSSRLALQCSPGRHHHHWLHWFGETLPSARSRTGHQSRLHHHKWCVLLSACMPCMQEHTKGFVHNQSIEIEEINLQAGFGWLYLPLISGRTRSWL